MAEDSHDPALPRRVRGNKHVPRTEPPAAPLVLPEPVRQQILSVLDGIRAEASPQELPAGAERTAHDHPARTEQPASPPRRVPDAGHRLDPPASTERPALPSSSPGCPSAEAPTEPLPAVAASSTSTETEGDEAQPDIAELPGLAAAAQIGRKLAAPALQAPAKERPEARTHGRRRTSYGLILIAVLVCGSLALVLARHAITAATGEGDRTTEVAIRDRAVAWVADQVSRSALVSCDRVMCKALAAHAFPAASLLELEPGAADPLRSSIIVSTAAVRSMIGRRVVANDAPGVIASFGSGNRQIAIRVVAPHGAAAYLSALSTDILARKASGTDFLDNQRITASATARSQLARGQVDSRLLTVIAGLAAQRPVSIVAFGDLAPGASPGIPLRSADLAGSGGAAGPHSAAQTQWMVAFLSAARPPYLAAHIHKVRLASGRTVVRIEFAAPSMLGLLSSRGY
jgi:hypothetical protein